MNSDHLERVTAFLDARSHSRDLMGPVHAAYVLTDDLTSAGPATARIPLCESDLRALVAELKQLRPEYGIRAEWISTLSSEGPVAETLGDALEALEDFDAKNGAKVVSRTLIERKVTGWEAVSTDG